MAQSDEDYPDCYHGNVQCFPFFLSPIYHWDCCKPFQDTVEVIRPLSLPVWLQAIKLFSYLLRCLCLWLVWLGWMAEPSPLGLSQNEDFDLMCTSITRSQGFSLYLGGMQAHSTINTNSYNTSGFAQLGESQIFLTLAYLAHAPSKPTAEE